MVTFSLHGTNFVRVLSLTWTCSSSIEFRYDSISNLSVVDICMDSFALQVYRRNMVPLGGQSPQEQHSQNVTREGHTSSHKALVMGVEVADLSHWVLHSTEAELGDCLEVPEKTGDSCRTESGGQGCPGCCRRVPNEITPKAVDKAVQVAADVFPMRSRMFREHRSSMAPLAIESDRVHLASSAGSVGAIVVPLMISQRPTDQR